MLLRLEYFAVFPLILTTGKDFGAPTIFLEVLTFFFEVLIAFLKVLLACLEAGAFFKGMRAGPSSGSISGFLLLVPSVSTHYHGSITSSALEVVAGGRLSFSFP